MPLEKWKHEDWKFEVSIGKKRPCFKKSKIKQNIEGVAVPPLQGCHMVEAVGDST